MKGAKLRCVINGLQGRALMERNGRRGEGTAADQLSIEDGSSVGEKASGHGEGERPG
jgi:hypothetical protein